MSWSTKHIRLLWKFWSASHVYCASFSIAIFDVVHVPCIQPSFNIQPQPTVLNLPNTRKRNFNTFTCSVHYSDAVHSFQPHPAIFLERNTCSVQPVRPYRSAILSTSIFPFCSCPDIVYISSKAVANYHMVVWNRSHCFHCADCGRRHPTEQSRHCGPGDDEIHGPWGMMVSFPWWHRLINAVDIGLHQL